MGKIICAHYGCGKTTFCKTHENSIDLDAAWFEKKKDGIQFILNVQRHLRKFMIMCLLHPIHLLYYY